MHIQKRLLLNNLNELHSFFKEHNPSVNIGFSKFAQLRPEECILVGASGTHSVCVCAIHQNVKLLLAGAKLQKLLPVSSNFPCTYKDVLSNMRCDVFSESCNLNNCKDCSGYGPLRKKLQDLFEQHFIISISCCQWTNTDRSNLEDIEYTTEEFLEHLETRLPTLQVHDFIAKNQSSYFKYCKENLGPDELVVVGDFAENYSFVIQDEVQSYHWSNKQATIHPFVAYYRINNCLQHDNFVIILDCKEHDSIAVHLFQIKLIQFFKQTHGTAINKIKYFSDGAHHNIKINIIY